MRTAKTGIKKGLQNSVFMRGGTARQGLVKREKKHLGGAFLKGAALIAISGIAAKVLGALYRIPLTNLLKSRGMGIYHMVFPFYTLLLAVSSAGIPAAISRLIAEHLNLHDTSGADRIFKSSFIMLSILGALLSAAMYIGADALAAMQQTPEAAECYRMISPSVFFVAQISVLRGYFQGRLNMLPTAVSQIVEQVVKMLFSLTVAVSFLPDIPKAAAYSILAVTVSELLCVVYLSFYYLRHRTRQQSNPVSPLSAHRLNYAVAKKITLSPCARSKLLIKKNIYSDNIFSNKSDIVVKAHQPKKQAAVKSSLASHPFKLYLPQRELAKDNSQKLSSAKKMTFMSAFITVLIVSVPVTLGSVILPVSHIIDSILVVRLLRAANGVSPVALYGLLSGPVNSVISLPVAAASGIAVAVIPYISATYASSNKALCKQRIEQSLRLTCAIALPSALLLYVFASSSMALLYPALSRAELAASTGLLKASVLTLVFLPLMQTTVSILVALRRSVVTTVNLLVGVVAKVLLSIILLKIPSININAAAVSAAVCYTVAATLNLLYIIQYAKTSIAIKKVFLAPLFCAVVSAIFASAADKVFSLLMPAHVGFIAAAFTAGVAYFMLSIKMGVITDRELNSLPVVRNIASRKLSRQ